MARNAMVHISFWFLLLMIKYSMYASDQYILGGSVHTIRKNTDVLLVGSKETGLEVNADKIKYMFVSGD